MPVSTSTTAAPDPTSGAGLPCVRCDYDLTGLGAGGRCPECGTPVAESLAVPTLAEGGAAWLRRVRRGAGLMVAALAGAVVLIVADIAADEVALAQRADWTESAGWASTLTAGEVALAALTVAGFWRLTAAPGGQRLAASLGPRRAVLRAIVVAGAVVGVASGAYDDAFAAVTGRPPTEAEENAGAVVGMVASLAVAAEYDYLRRLARVARNDSLGRWLTVAAGAFIVLTAGLGTFAAAQATGTLPATPPVWFVASTFVVVVGALGTAVVAYVGVFVRLRQVLDRFSESVVERAGGRPAAAGA